MNLSRSAATIRLRLRLRAARKVREREGESETNVIIPKTLSALFPRQSARNISYLRHRRRRSSPGRRSTRRRRTSPRSRGTERHRPTASGTFCSSMSICPSLDSFFALDRTLLPLFFFFFSLSSGQTSWRRPPRIKFWQRLRSGRDRDLGDVQTSTFLLSFQKVSRR